MHLLTCSDPASRANADCHACEWLSATLTRLSFLYLPGPPFVLEVPLIRNRVIANAIFRSRFGSSFMRLDHSSNARAQHSCSCSMRCLSLQSAHEAMHGHPVDQLNSKLWDYHSLVWDVFRSQVQQLKLSLSTVQVEERYKQLWDQSADRYDSFERASGSVLTRVCCGVFARLCDITTPKTYVGLYGGT